MFTTTRRITLRDTDAAGFVYFARYLAMAHDAYEEFLASRGFDLARHLREGTYLVPILHAKSNHHLPLWCGELATISVKIDEINRRTFHVSYEIRNGDGALAVTCNTVHVAVDKTTRRAIPVPEDLLKMLRG